MKNMVELTNKEICEYCMLNRKTGEIVFYKNKKIEGFTGYFYRDNSCFFGIYPTLVGPTIYYEGREYLVNPNLEIFLIKKGENRIFGIKDYGIIIEYIESQYIGIDSWSNEIDIDLFYMIEQNYKIKSFYEKFTVK